jgi:ribosome-associated toxin RatA of RatAB toxin-antitoxin module
MRVPAPVHQVWNTLTNYNRLSEFVPDLAASRVIGELDGDPLVYQQGRVKILFYVFRGSVTLKIHEKPLEEISFSQVSGDFDYFNGAWFFKPAEDGMETDVVYTLWAHPKFYIPQWLLRMMLHKDVPKRLGAIRREIVSTYGTPGGEGPPSAGDSGPSDELGPIDATEQP